MTEAITAFKEEFFFLSNFYSSLVFLDGHPYPTVEHAYQAAKTTDLDLRRLIALKDSPGKAKKEGRKLRLRQGWDGMKIEVMELLLAQKFAPGTPLAARLLETGDAPLVEGNWWGDRFWGVCDGEGQNWLGKLLMAQREALRSRT